MFGSADRRRCGENIITRYQMTILVEALYSRNPLFADSRRRFYCGVRELSDGFILSAFLSLIVATALWMVKHLRVLLIVRKLCNKGFRLFSVFEPESLIAVVCEKFRYAENVTFRRDYHCAFSC